MVGWFSIYFEGTPIVEEDLFTIRRAIPVADRIGVNEWLARNWSLNPTFMSSMFSWSWYCPWKLPVFLSKLMISWCIIDGEELNFSHCERSIAFVRKYWVMIKSAKPHREIKCIACEMIISRNSMSLRRSWNNSFWELKFNTSTSSHRDSKYSFGLNSTEPLVIIGLS